MLLVEARKPDDKWFALAVLSSMMLLLFTHEKKHAHTHVTVTLVG